MNEERLLAHKLRNNVQTVALIATLGLPCAYLARFIGGPLLAWGATVGVLFLFLGNPPTQERVGRLLKLGSRVRLPRSVSDWLILEPRDQSGSIAGHVPLCPRWHVSRLWF